MLWLHAPLPEADIRRTLSVLLSPRNEKQTEDGPGQDTYGPLNLLVIRSFDTIMSSVLTESQSVTIPGTDGQVTKYINQEAAQTRYFNHGRTVIFINGMANSGHGHAKSALALSLLQMCPVIGVYNQSSGVIRDLRECYGDKDQFNGPLSFSAKNRAALGTVFHQATSEQVILNALGRNPSQVRLFHLLRQSEHRQTEIFAHSQGNLILSNALQGIAAVDGPQSVQGRIVHTFGSPAINWPSGIRKLDHGFTFDPVNWLSGIDLSFRISKVGMPDGSWNPISHGFRVYLENDPAFVINRYRIGGAGITFHMDETGLADCLLDMGTNLPRVQRIFEYLDDHHNRNADDVALRYVNGLRKNASLANCVAQEPMLVQLLIRVMQEGYTTSDEKAAIDWLEKLSR